MTHSRLPNFSRLVSGGVEEAGMKGWRERSRIPPEGAKARFTRVSRGLAPQVDSCDILLDCQLKVLMETNRRYRGHADQVAKILPDYPKWIGTIRRAQELHGKADLESDNREAAYDSLAPVIDELQDIINKLADCADEIEASIRRAEVIFWLTVVAALATIAGFLFPVMFKIASMLLR